MKALISTHHLHHWAGSELVTIELLEEFRRQGHEVSVFCPFFRPGFAQQAFGDWRVVIADPAKVNLADYDLVVILHQTAARFLDRQDPSLLFGKEGPYFIYMHLSPYEPFEAPGPFSQPILADMVLANSEETRAALAGYGYSTVELFENPAPAEFAICEPPPERLGRILSVSNHLPKEMADALDLLRDRGIDVYRIGRPENARRVRPYDLAEHDAVITIGKTAQYALRAGRPVFCYDIFQGPGWIHRDFETCAAVNISGRCHRVGRSAEELAQEIESGYAAARAWSAAPPTWPVGRFALEAHVARMVEAASRGKRSKPIVPMSERPAMIQRFKLEKTIYSQIDRAYESQSGVPSLVVAKPWEEITTPDAISMVWLRQPRQGEAVIVAVFSYRYDAHLVPDLLENIAPAVHGYAAWDDRSAAEHDAFTDETTRQKALFDAARQMGADWLFAVDPDERYESAIATKITDMTTRFGPMIWTFECREMFNADSYRVDGVWSGRPRVRLFPCLPGMEPDGRVLHGFWTGNALKLEIRHSGLNFYHLRMATPARRALRRAQYATIDSPRAHQKIGYDYLDDERGMILQFVPADRGFHPPHVEDQGLWAAERFAAGPSGIPPDPPDAQLQLLTETRRRGGFRAAWHMARDLHERDPEDQEYALLVADSAMRAGQWADAAQGAGAICKTDPEALMAHLILARAFHALGQESDAQSALDKAEALCPQSLFVARIRERIRPEPQAFIAPDAAWRQWAPGRAELHEGADVATCDLTFVVLSMGAPPELERAIASLCSEAVLPEIVVVNSGGGDVLGRLADYADRLRVITIKERLLPGAARNVGIDASRGRFVAFLASDCTITEGGVAARLRLHEEGARAVSAYVLPEDEDSPFQQVASLILHSTRHPRSGMAADKRYSLSYDRSLFEEIGYFPPGLRVGEDSYINAQVSLRCEIAISEDVCIRHRYPEDAEMLEQDMMQRAIHRVHTPQFGVVRDLQELRSKTSNARDAKLALCRQVIALRKGEFAEGRLQQIEVLLARMLDAERHAAFEEGRQLVRASELAAQAECCATEDAEEAARLLREAVSLQPQSPLMRLRLARVLRDRADEHSKAEAIATLRVAVTINPGDATILKTLIDCLITDGEEAQARDIFEAACILSPVRIDIWEAHGALRAVAPRPLRVYALSRMFFLNPMDRNIATTLVENHRRSGNHSARLARARNSAIVLTEPECEAPPPQKQQALEPRDSAGQSADAQRSARVRLKSRLRRFKVWMRARQ